MDSLRRLTLKWLGISGLGGGLLAGAAWPMGWLAGAADWPGPTPGEGNGAPPGRPDYHVDPVHGDDGHDGRSPDRALRSFTRLLHLYAPFHPGAVIGIRAGTTIGERLHLVDQQGSRERPIRVVPYGDGDKPRWVSGDNPRIHVQNCAWVHLHGLANRGGGGHSGIVHENCRDCRTVGCESSGVAGRNHGFLIHNCQRCVWEACVANGNGAVTDDTRTRVGNGFLCMVTPRHAFDKQDDILFLHCSADRNAEDGFHMFDKGAGQTITIRGCSGRFNHEDFADNKGCQNLVIERCIMADNEEKAIPVHGFAGHTTLRWNLVARNGRKNGFEAITIDGKTGGSFGAPEHRVAIYGNLIVDNFGKAISWRHDADTLLIAHNTIVNNCRRRGTSQVHHRPKSNAAQTVLRNNIIAMGARHAKAYHDEGNSAKTLESHNILHGGGPVAVQIRRHAYSGAAIAAGHYTRRESSRFGQYSLAAAPRFANRAEGDYRLATGSPGQAAGLAGVAPVPRDFAGTAFGEPPNMGAFGQKTV